MRILHVLDHSLPNLSGYSIRSEYIVRMQRRLGLDPIVVTSPKHKSPRAEGETRAGLYYQRVSWPRYYFLPWPRVVPGLKHAACVAALAREVTRLGAERKVDIIHAHSPSLMGLAASRAARRLGVPLVYELRYYDEEAAVARRKTGRHSLRYILSRHLENTTLRRADRVVTISRALRADLIARGVPADKVVEVPNGVDTDFFRPAPPDAELIARYGLAGKTVVGFIGKFFAWEGLDHLMEAMLLLLRQRDDVKLLLAGYGEREGPLRARVPERWREHLLFAGRVPHDDVRRYYSVMDIMAYPRDRSRLTELTTPLKPLEAMAMERVVVGSDIGGMRELVRSGHTGFLVEPANPAELANLLSDLADNPAVRRAVGSRARKAVVQDRDWLHIAGRYVDIYRGSQAGERAVRVPQFAASATGEQQL